jgi:hypothetical protein
MVNDKLNKEAKHALDLSLNVLEHAMELALQKEDLDAIIAISDRLMMLYQHLADKNVKKFKTGFSIMEPMNKKQEEDDDGESD